MQGAKKINWGMLGTGNIAGKFAEALALVPEAQPLAVASRTLDSAQRFAAQHGYSKAYGAYEQLAQDPEIDIVYVSTPNPYHFENTMMLLEAGKAVLCEKPFAMNKEEAQAMVDKAREKKVFLMEAMWTRFFPLVRELRRRIAEGQIGELRAIEACFGFAADYNPESRLFSESLGGGALLDLGVYPVSFTHMLCGSPESLQSVATLGQTGVDHQSSYLLKYANGLIANLAASFEAHMTQQGTVYGSKGRIQLVNQFHCPTRMVVTRDGESEPEVLESPVRVNGLEYEAQAVTDCLRRGELECAEMTLDESLAIMQTLDALRASWQA